MLEDATLVRVVARSHCELPPDTKTYFELLDFLPAPTESEDVLLELLRAQRAGGRHTGPLSHEEPLRAPSRHRDLHRASGNRVRVIPCSIRATVPPPDTEAYFEVLDIGRGRRRAL